MTEELKTLKEIMNYDGLGPCPVCLNSPDEIRAEAIKWFKNIQSPEIMLDKEGIKKFMGSIPLDIVEGNIKNPNDFSLHAVFDLGMEYGAMAILKQIFNITDEELNEKAN